MRGKTILEYLGVLPPEGAPVPTPAQRAQAVIVAVIVGVAVIISLVWFIR